jgi:hypothetical protein
MVLDEKNDDNRCILIHESICRQHILIAYDHKSQQSYLCGISLGTQGEIR